MRWLALLVLAAVPLSPAAREAGTIALAADAEDRWVPFALTAGNQIRFTVMLDGRPVGAILDTGVSFTLLSRVAADPARVQVGGSAQAVGGAVALGWMPTTSLSFGGLTQTGGGVTVADLPALATGGLGAGPIAMLVGRDLLEGYALDIDFAARRFRLLRSGRLPFRGASAPLTVTTRRQVYESALTLAGRRVAPVIVDTGDGAAVTLTAAAWRDSAPAGVATTDALAFGLAGPTVSDRAIHPAIGRGALTAREVEVRIEPTDGFNERVGVAGRIGAGLFQRYRVLLDPGAGRMVLSTGPGTDQQPPRSTTGLLIGQVGTRLKVLHVMRGGPAAVAGWRAGELICAVDGVAIGPGYATSPAAGWTAGAPGTRVSFAMCDGTARTLVLRRFY